MKTVITAIANPIINNELKKEKNIEKETKEKAYQLARIGNQCSDRLNHRNNTYHNW